MPKGKIAKSIVKKAKPYAQKAKLGAGAAIAEKATDIVDNPLVSAAEGALVGYAVGGPVGAAAGGLIGWVLADGERIVPCDMIAIPAYQYGSMLSGREPTWQMFIKEGEVVMPVQPTDFMESVEIVDLLDAATSSKPRKKSKWQKYMGQKKNQIKFKSGKRKGQLDLKKMGKAFRNGRKK
ncbi:MAG: hypothetical protein [Circular genetic element sp.]|nr:MAG: hypothetical protein [Circular genetic element sp.]